MKPNPFKQTLLTAGVITALGLSGNALADVTVSNTKLDSGDAASSIENIANATYSVDGVAQLPVESNAVVVNITEKAAFSLIATNQDGTPNDNYNDQLEVAPKGVVVFNHTLKNEGNVEDTYTLTLGQDGSTPGTANDTKDYDLANTKVTYVINRADGTKETVTTTGTEFNNTKVTLAPNEFVEITINGVTTNNLGGDTQNLTLAAQSTYFQGLAPSDATKNTITNVDNSQTKLPVFSIIKKAVNTLNLNDPNSTVDYTIDVTNAQTAYSTRATNISIIDNLPQGLKIVPGSVKVASNPSTEPGTPNIVENSNGAGTGTNVDGFIITGVNLDVGKTVKVTFKVQKDEAEEFIAKDNVINHASVEDDLDDNPDTDNTVVDSTDPESPNQNTDQFYPNEGDDEVIDGSTPTTPGTDSTGPLIINQRGLELSNPTTAELPNTSTANTQAKHETIIKNTGKEIEGDKAGELTFTITDGGLNPNVSPVSGDVTIEYDADGNPDTPNQTVTITPTTGADGIPVYDINTALPGGMAPGSTVTIKYDVKSDAADTGTKETTVVTLIPGGTDAPPAPAPVVDTTNVKGLDLLKEQALQADCKSPVSDTAFSIEPINAVKPGQCIVYRITATNGFTNLNMTDVLIYDTTARFDGKAIYKKDGSISVGTADSTASNPVVKNASNSATGGDAIYTTVNTLAAQDKAVLKFSVQIDPTGAAQ